MEDDEIVANGIAESSDESEEKEAIDDKALIHLILLKKWHDTAAQMKQESLRQTHITSELHSTYVLLVYMYARIIFPDVAISELRVVPSPKLPR